jgi:pyroglutamyl-peptidase
MAEAIRAVDIPSQLSYSAGAYVCNDLFYSLLAHFKGSSTRVGFIHIPYCEEQNKQPSMPLTAIISALTVAIESIDG